MISLRTAKGVQGEIQELTDKYISEIDDLLELKEKRLWKFEH